MYPFATLYWENNLDNMYTKNFPSPYNIFLAITENNFFCLKLLFLRPNQHLSVRIQQNWQ